MPELYCKICAPRLTGNGYCAEHSSNGRAYFDDVREYSLPTAKSIDQFKQEVIDEIENLDCKQFHGGDQCCWEEYDKPMKNRIIEIIKSK